MMPLPLRSEPCACGDAIATWDVTRQGIARAVDLHSRGEAHRAWRMSRELDLIDTAESFGRVPLATTAGHCCVTCPQQHGASSSTDRARRLHR